MIESSTLTAVYDALRADAALEVLLEAGRGVALSPPLPVYRAAAPPDEPFPFLVFDLVSSTPWDSSDREGVELRFDVSAYSQRSAAEAAGLMGRVHTILHDGALTITGATCVLIRRDGAATETDGQIHRARETFRAIVRKAP